MQIISEEAKIVSSGAHTTAASSQEQLAITEEISSSAIMLAKMAEELQNLITKFKMA
ncbi:hypothetical protein [Metabacillus sp. RGM 3146]|uniref:hypothetical protein n=1 Tax=Metabacillus sp. RGM 3146 TaxID=3401092 RepID=UPI003B99CC1E